MCTKKLLKNKINYYFGIFVASLFFFGCSYANAATLQINSNSNTLSAGETATLYVVLNSEGVAVNNAEATISFPTTLFDVVSISKVGSVFSLWVEEPYFSNASGVISFNGGVPTPGFNGSQGPVVSIVVRAKSTGQANFAFASAAVRANDGLGTDVLNGQKGKVLSVAPKEDLVLPEPPKPEVITTPASSAVTLQITSPTHISQELWYRDTSPLFRWKIPPGVDSVQTGIYNNTGGSPRVTYTPAIDEKSVKDLEDGIWYFKVRARKDAKWGPISTYIARIDNAIPVKNSVNFSYDDNKKNVEINADIIDETSGIEYYEIYVNDILLKKVSSSEFNNGNYNLPVDIPGNNTVKLVAVDRAGNSVESIGAFNASPSAPAPSETDASTLSVKGPILVTVGSVSVPVFYAATIIILLAIILIMIAFYFGRQYSKLQHKFKVRSALVKGDSGKVLLLLKKRLEKHLEILQQTRHNRILSKEEREIKEAIEGDLDEVDKALGEEK